MEKKREKPELIGDIRLANTITVALCSRKTMTTYPC